MTNVTGRMRDKDLQTSDRLSLITKVMLVVVPVLLLVLMVQVFHFASQPDYVELVRSEDRAQLERIRDYLDENGYTGQYKIVSDTEIQIDKAIEPQVTLALAGEGLIGNQSGVGFEIFDNIQLGMTDRMFEMQELRAIQGVLAEYIVKTYPTIDQARIVINQGKTAADGSLEIPPSASIKLDSQTEPDSTQILTIQKFVAASVPGLDASAIRVVDGKNTLISSIEMK